MDDSDEYDFEVDPEYLRSLPWLETPLDAKKNSIRLARLEAATRDSPIICNLQCASLDDHPIYEAISYAWGDSCQTQTILVSGVVFHATHNLANCLRWLRSETVARLLWVDAICIDQTNEDEKSSQIALMSRIYRQAGEVHIWLGPFTGAWTAELRDTADHWVPALEFSPEEWIDKEKECRDNLAQYMAAGGQAGEPRDISTEKAIMLQTLELLDQLEAGKHSYEFPLFCKMTIGTKEAYVVNRSWLVLGDCFQWLVSRPWWTRVWTFQEAILPRVDPLVHAEPHSFRLSRLFSIHNHNKKHMQCCRKLAPLWALMRGPSGGSLALGVCQSRELVSSTGSLSLEVGEVLEGIRERRASEPKDHFIGILGLLSQELQSNWLTVLRPSASAAEVFSQCSKYLYSSTDSLEELGQATGFRGSHIRGLPSWAIDLSARTSHGYAGDDSWQWELFNASSRSKFDGVRNWDELAGTDLRVKVIHVGNVGACGRHLGQVKDSSPRNVRGDEVILRCVSEWEQLYTEFAAPADLDRFWRAVVMDRNVWRWPFAERNRMPPKRLVNFQHWWRSWKESGDARDLDTDNMSADQRRGDYHFRALRVNVTTHRFMCTFDGEPGIGPLQMNVGDEVFIIKGCPAPGVLRRVKDGPSERFAFVGLCFLDGWMYGTPSPGWAPWQDVTLC